MRSSGDGAARSASPRGVPATRERARRRFRRDRGESGPPEDAEAIAQLLYQNYHLSYVHADFYRPRYLIAGFATGGLLSAVAVHDGQVVGHHALMPLPGSRPPRRAPRSSTPLIAGSVCSAGCSSTRSARRSREASRPSSEMPSRSIPSANASRPRTATARLRSSSAWSRRRPRCVASAALGLSTNRHAPFVPSSRRGSSASRASDRVSRPARADLRQCRALARGGCRAGSGRGRCRHLVLDEPRSLGFLRVRRWDGSPTRAERVVRDLLSRHVDVVYADVDLAAVAAVDEAAAAATSSASSSRG